MQIVNTKKYKTNNEKVNDEEVLPLGSMSAVVMKQMTKCDELMQSKHGFKNGSALANTDCS